MPAYIPQILRIAERIPLEDSLENSWKILRELGRFSENSWKICPQFSPRMMTDLWFSSKCTWRKIHKTLIGIQFFCVRTCQIPPHGSDKPAVPPHSKPLISVFFPDKYLQISVTSKITHLLVALCRQISTKCHTNLCLDKWFSTAANIWYKQLFLVQQR